MGDVVRYRPGRVAQAFHDSDAFVRALMGPIGSGKSTSCCWEIFSRINQQKPGADGIRRSRWMVARNSYRELKDTSQATWWQWFPQSLGRWYASDMVQTIESGDVYAEILFRSFATPEDVKKLLSLELTGIWWNEAREFPLSVIEMGSGRVGRYPAAKDGGSAWSGMILDTNPPDSVSWFYRLFEDVRPAGWEIFKQPGGRSPEAENVANLPGGYYDRIAAGKVPEWVKVYVDGQYGFLAEGLPIYPEWNDTLHAVANAWNGGPVLVGMDFGLTPAAVIGQRAPDDRQLQVIAELVGEGMGAQVFGRELAQMLRARYPGAECQIWGDPAGEAHAQTDETTVFQILRAQGIHAVPAPSNDFTLRREAVAGLLTRLTVKGRPALVVSPACQVTRRGMMGGYRYRRLQIAGADARYQDKPDKNAYSHPCEALQYLCIGDGEGGRVIGAAGWERPLPYRERKGAVHG